jgi:hypothetical protein
MSAGWHTADWTPARVEDRLRKAVALRTRLPDCGSDIGPTAEGIGIIGGIGVGEGTDDAVVADAVQALSWLRWLEPDDAEIVLARLEGAPWKLICWRFGISRPTADRRWRYSLALIVWRLNGKTRSEPTPSLRSLLGLRRAA